LGYKVNQLLFCLLFNDIEDTPHQQPNYPTHTFIHSSKHHPSPNITPPHFFRKKGPIKAYALSMYAPSSSLTTPLSNLYRSLRLSTGGEGARTFLMKVTFKVSSEKMANALCDSLGTRYKGELGEVKDTILRGGKGGKGTVFQVRGRCMLETRAMKLTPAMSKRLPNKPF
jgi:hypothetical protein